jgi:hypothetical protein
MTPGATPAAGAQMTPAAGMTPGATPAAGAQMTPAAGMTPGATPAAGTVPTAQNPMLLVLANQPSQNLIMIDTRTNQIVGQADVGAQPRSITASQDGRFAFIASQDGSVRTFDVANRRVVTTAQAQPNPTDIDFFPGRIIAVTTPAAGATPAAATTPAAGMTPGAAGAMTTPAAGMTPGATPAAMTTPAAGAATTPAAGMTPVGTPRP